MKETIADINSREMAWTIEQLNQWTKDNLEGTRVSIMWHLVSPHCAERLYFLLCLLCKEAVIVLTETSCNHADTSKDSGIYMHHIL
jgi:hypothetical protein